jgi:uncharacterized membrane protein (TIGR02234 family)
MGNRREFLITLLICLAGAGLAVFAAGRTWAEVSGGESIVATAPLTLSGSDLSGVSALGWVGVAGLAALLATSGWARRALGVLLVLLGAGISTLSATAIGRSHLIEVAVEKRALLKSSTDLVPVANSWWLVSLAGGVLLALAGVITFVRGGRWPGMSARYDSANAAPKKVRDDPAGLWKSLDRGEDPTREDSGREDSGREDSGRENSAAEHLDAP